MEHRADLPDLVGVELNPLDQSKLQCLQILEWFQTHGKDINFDSTSKESTSPSTRQERLLNWLQQFNPEQDLVNNVWVKKVANTQDFELLIKRIKKEPEYAEYFRHIVSKRKDGYKSEQDDGPTNSYKVNENEVELVADSLFLKDVDLAYRVLKIKSPFKCLDCHETNCDPREVQISWSTSPETMSKLFALLSEDDISLERILVLGSGIGSVTFCTHLFVRDSKITSCEWDPKLIDIQRGVVHKHGIEDRVTVLQNWVPEESGVVKCMDLVIGCERLFTASISGDVKQRGVIFMTLKKFMKSGARLILYRKLEDWLDEGLNLANLKDWLVLEHELSINDDEEALYYHVYKVL